MTDEREYRTKSGRILTDEDFERLADEAEAGYDVAHLKPREPTFTVEQYGSVFEVRDDGMTYRNGVPVIECATCDELVDLVAIDGAFAYSCKCGTEGTVTVS